MGIVFLLSAFAGSLLAGSRSLGWGFLAVVAVGYFNGVVRANFLGVFTTFMFDAALFGLYLGYLSRRSRWAGGGGSGPAGGLVVFLMVWPSLLCLVPANHYLVQCVALRAAIWFLPVLLIAAQLGADDLGVLTRGLAVLNLVALAVGAYIFLYGVDALYPKNAVTEIIYKSRDVGGRTSYHRVPSLFLNAHSYGGTMLYTLPFLLDRLAGVGVRMRDRLLAAAGVVAAAGGLLMCGARSPLVVLGLALVVAWALTRFSLRLGAVLAILFGAAAIVAGSNERFQRASTLGDSESVSQRIEGSVNEGFLELMFRYPLGAGLGSAVGTSIPFFLSDVAPEQIGLENEFSRILVDQGWFGLAGWIALLVFLYARPPSTQLLTSWGLAVVFMYSLTLAFWATAFIGTGILTSIPGTFLLMTQMGVLVAVRYQRGARGPTGVEAAPCEGGPPDLTRGMERTISRRACHGVEPPGAAMIGPRAEICVGSAPSNP
ncbi:MAG TPA: hypothetical protein VFF52_04290 [Isosphaeraceae bacterium]|nr:hypothetical protein [Isosphaeraceae bacterium]